MDSFQLVNITETQAKVVEGTAENDLPELTANLV